MRVTTQMMIGNLSRQLNRQRESIDKLSTMTVTGKIINQPSDDPALAACILNSRSTISEYAQRQSSLSQTQSWIEAGDTVLETVYDLLNQAQDIVTEQSGGDLDTRETLAATVRSLYDQIVDLANTEFNGSYMYSGDANGTRPFGNESVISGGAAEDIVFDLAAAAQDATVTIYDSSGTAVRTLTLSGLSSGTNVITWDGLDNGGNPLADGTYTYEVEAADAAGDPVAAYHTYRGQDGNKEALTGSGGQVNLNTDGGEIFSEVLRSLSQAIAVMESDSYTTSGLAACNDDLESVLEGLRLEIVTLSMVNARLDTDQDWVSQTLQIYENKLSQDESCDVDQAAVELQTVEDAYEVTLETVAMILNQTNLMKLL